MGFYECPEKNSEYIYNFEKIYKNRSVFIIIYQ